LPNLPLKEIRNADTRNQFITLWSEEDTPFVILVNSNGAPGVGAVAVVYRVYFARRNHDEGHSHGERPFFIARDIPAFLSRYPGERLPFQRIARDFLVQRALALQDAGIEME